MNIIVQLMNIYLNKEDWHRTKLSPEEAKKYFKRLVDKGSILWQTENGKVIGYVEYWKLNLPQFRKVLINNFSAYLEDIQHGYICYVANVWVDEDHRNSGVLKVLKNRLFENNKDCLYFVGEAVKQGRRLKVHRRL